VIKNVFNVFAPKKKVIKIFFNLFTGKLSTQNFINIFTQKIATKRFCRTFWTKMTTKDFFNFFNLRWSLNKTLYIIFIDFFFQKVYSLFTVFFRFFYPFGFSKKLLHSLKGTYKLGVALRTGLWYNFKML
jgi:hypothetical protein